MRGIGGFESFEYGVIGHFGGGEGSEGANVAVVVIGIDVEADRFEAGGDFALEFRKGE